MLDAGPFRVRKYESVVIGLDTSAEVVSEEQKANLLDSRLCCWLVINSRCARLGLARISPPKIHELCTHSKYNGAAC